MLQLEAPVSYTHMKILRMTLVYITGTHIYQASLILRHGVFRNQHAVLRSHRPGSARYGNGHRGRPLSRSRRRSATQRVRNTERCSWFSFTHHPAKRQLILSCRPRCVSVIVGHEQHSFVYNIYPRSKGQGALGDPRPVSLRLRRSSISVPFPLLKDACIV